MTRLEEPRSPIPFTLFPANHLPSEVVAPQASGQYPR